MTGESYEKAKICYICKEKIEGKHMYIAYVISSIVYLKKFP